jgi:hypothetical protein
MKMGKDIVLWAKAIFEFMVVALAVSFGVLLVFKASLMFAKFLGL